MHMSKFKPWIFFLISVTVLLILKTTSVIAISWATVGLIVLFLLFWRILGFLLRLFLPAVFMQSNKYEAPKKEKEE